MNKIKTNRVNQNIKVNDIKYRAYKVGELPNSFGYIYDEINESDGIKSWFNWKGLTYIRE
jgi:hypothetical protein